MTANQVHAFVLRKVKYEMVDKVQEELKAFKSGLYDVISAEDMKGLTADDLQLLLSGKAEVRILPHSASLCLVLPRVYHSQLNPFAARLLFFAQPITTAQLRELSTFEDARGVALRSAEPEQLERFTALFWETVESMDKSERLKLVGMATGSLVRLDASIPHLQLKIYSGSVPCILEACLVDTNCV